MGSIYCNNGGGKGGAPATNPATTELLAEATQLLKSLQMPNMNMVRLPSIKPEAHMVLLDSGSTNALRPADSQAEWEVA